MPEGEQGSEKVDRDASDWANEHLYSMNRHDLAREAFRAGYEQCEDDQTDDPADSA
jgi:hypothetical protein